MRSLKTVAIVSLIALALVATATTGRAKDDDNILRLHLLFTNDMHGHIAPEMARFMNPEHPPPLGGGASAARYIKGVRAAAAASGEEVLLMDVGDMFQGTPIGNKTKGTAVIEYYNAIGYDFAVPGNHDFDMGRDNAERLAKLSNFPWLCSNIFETSTGEVIDWVKPTKMLDFQGIKIGVVGLITPGTASMSFPENIKGLEFRDMPDILAMHRDELRDQGADLVLLGIHEGLPYDAKEGWKRIAGENDGNDADDTQGSFGSNHSHGSMNLMELVNTVSGIDVAVGGHTHRGYHLPWIDPNNHTMCFETFGNGSSIGHAILLIDRETKSLIGYEGGHDRGTLITLFEDEIWPDAEITEVIRPFHEEAEAEMDRVIGRAAYSLGRGDPGANLVANLVTDAMVAYFDADFSFQNGGGLRSDIAGGGLRARDIFAVLPFGNELDVVEMDGRMVRLVIERRLAGSGRGIHVGGVKLVLDPTRPEYDRVVSFEINGEPWNADKIYKVIVTSFLMEGNSGLDFLTTIPADKITPTGVTTSEAVERYIVLNSPVSPRIDDRWLESKGAKQEPYLAVTYLP
ncbi:MAG: 5'-nucleotidase/UDP-sugar diphosphatase [Candidatus Krumholzibacteriia bacterium]|jgi:5'-nucleotidase/UDP-sugar diphosphatase